MPVQIQGDVTAEYSPVITIADTGEVLTEAQIYDTTLALANRIEYVHALVAAEETLCVVREDFLGATWTESASTLQGNVQWRTFHDGSPAVNVTAGTNKNPGLLDIQLPGNGVDYAQYGFELISTTGVPFSFATFETATVVVKPIEDPANVTARTQFGLVSEADAQNGGNNSIKICRCKALNATKWTLLRSVGGVNTTTALTSATYADSEYAVWKITRDSATGDYILNLNGTDVHTLDSADVPTGGCNFGTYTEVTVADTEVHRVVWDFISLRSATGDRSGA
jgi:hypothetical protein